MKATASTKATTYHVLLDTTVSVSGSRIKLASGKVICTDERGKTNRKCDEVAAKTLELLSQRGT